MTVPLAPITLKPIGPGPIYQTTHIWLPQLFLEASRTGDVPIQNRTFTECLIEGPAVLLPVDGCSFDGCSLGDAQGDPRNLLLRPLGPQKVTGAIAFKNCTFYRCRFHAVGFTGTEAFLDDLVKMLGGAPA